MEEVSGSASKERFAVHVARLQETFATFGLSFGKATDVSAIAASLSKAGPVSSHVADLIRTMSSGVGGDLSRAEIVSVLVVAAGGGDLYASARKADALPRLRAFVDTTLNASPAATSAQPASPELRRRPTGRSGLLWLGVAFAVLLTLLATPLWRHPAVVPARSPASPDVPTAQTTPPPQSRQVQTAAAAPMPMDESASPRQLPPAQKTGSPGRVDQGPPATRIGVGAHLSPPASSAPAPAKSGLDSHQPPAHGSASRDNPSASSTHSRGNPVAAVPMMPTPPGGFLVSSGVMSRNLLSAPVPSYPKMAKAWGVEGQVVLQAVISSKGQVISAHALDGHRLLRRSAENAIRTWRYKPRVVNGKATDVATVVIVNYRLNP